MVGKRRIMVRRRRRGEVQIGMDCGAYLALTPSAAQSPADIAEARSCYRVNLRGLLSWRHADRAVEADRLAIEHRVLDDRPHQLRIFLGPAEAARVRTLRPEAVLRGLRQADPHRRQDTAGRGGDAPTTPDGATW